MSRKTYRKKSQAAMEFLMTYGWALLVVLIVIAALAFFGVLNPNRFLPEKCEFGPGITCVDFTATSTGAVGSFQLLVNNGIGSIMKSTNISVLACTTTVASSAPTNIPQGVTQNVSIANCNGVAPGGKFKSDLMLNYTTTTDGNTISHSRLGYLVVEVRKV